MNPTSEGMALVKRWQSVQTHLNVCRRSVNQAECDLSNAASELVKWLVPEGAKIGEVFCVPIGEAFLEVRIEGRQLVEIPAKEEFEPDGSPRTYTRTVPTPKVGWRNGVTPRDF